VFWVISVYFNIRNTLPKSGPFLLLHPVYIYIYIYRERERERERECFATTCIIEHISSIVYLRIKVHNSAKLIKSFINYGIYKMGKSCFH
jgi:ABC-type polysaccharide/polyol phosphate export permease